MPRELRLDEKPVALTESPHSTEDGQQNNVQVILAESQEAQPSGKTDSVDKLHPYTRLLTISDLESCVALENAAFDAKERCSRNKVS